MRRTALRHVPELDDLYYRLDDVDAMRARSARALKARWHKSNSKRAVAPPAPAAANKEAPPQNALMKALEMVNSASNGLLKVKKSS